MDENSILEGADEASASRKAACVSLPDCPQFSFFT